MMSLQTIREKTIWILVGGWGIITILNAALLPRKYAPHVDIEIVKQAPLPLLVRASGNLEAKDSNTIKAQFDGDIVSKKFREGQTVLKGELLAVINRDRIELDFQNKKDSLSNAESDLAHARRDVRLQKQLFKKEAVAYSTVEDAQRMLVKAEQGLRSAKEAFALAQDQWNSANVIAPINGTVVKDWIHEDKSVAAGKDIVTVADVSEYTVHAKVDELDIHQVKEGQPADVRIQIFKDTPLAAVVAQVGSQLEGTGLPEIPVVLRLTESQGLELRPKLTAEGRIMTGQTEPLFSVPLSAIVNNDGNPHVWVLTMWKRLRQRAVQLGRANPDRVEITQGLAMGERVIVSAEPDFADGMRVILGKPDPGSHSRTAKFLPAAAPDQYKMHDPRKL